MEVGPDSDSNFQYPSVSVPGKGPRTTIVSVKVSWGREEELTLVWALGSNDGSRDNLWTRDTRGQPHRFLFLPSSSPVWGDRRVRGRTRRPKQLET